MQEAYLLFSLHHVMPSEYYAMGYRERMVARAFLEQEIEDRSAAQGTESEIATADDLRAIKEEIGIWQE